MTSRARRMLSVEALEDRSVPAVTASVVNGSLVVLGDSAASHVAITASDTNNDKVADSFKVSDGAATVGTFSGVTGDLVLRLGKGDDAVSIDLGGLSTPHGIRPSLGSGNNTLTVTNGTVKGSLSVQGKDGTDGLTLGGTTALTINGDVSVHLEGHATGKVELKGTAAVKGDLWGEHAGTVLLDAGSTVGKDVFLHGGPESDTLNLAGTVGGDVVFLGGKNADTLTVTGKIGGNLFAFLGEGNDVANIGGTVSGFVFLDGGHGNDSLTLSGTVGGRTLVLAGPGDDAVTIAATANLKSAASVELGSGSDKLTLDGSAHFTHLFAKGGSGKDTFVGNKAQTGLKLEGF
jgi:hypothetical protein